MSKKLVYRDKNGMHLHVGDCVKFYSWVFGKMLIGRITERMPYFSLDDFDILVKNAEQGEAGRYYRKSEYLEKLSDTETFLYMMEE